MQDSYLVTLLKDLGAIPFCKTNVPQTMMAAETNNNVFGRTLNPFNLDLTSGGSSGGEAALIAMKGSIIGFGTDYGGSIRFPAHCNGLYGLRPTTRRLPYMGVENVLKGCLANESVVGPLARSLSSIQTVMKAIIDRQPWLDDPKLLERVSATLVPVHTVELMLVASLGSTRFHRKSP